MSVEVMRKFGASVFEFLSIPSFRFLLHRFAAAGVLTALLAPLFLFGQLRTAAANPAQPAPAAIVTAPIASIPPENFVFPKNKELSFNLGTAISFAALNETILGAFKKPELPAGFEAAKTVSPASRALSSVSSTISSSIGSFFGFFASASTISKTTTEKEASVSPNALPGQPAGAVNFDFTADGKADVAGWRPSLNKWEVKDSSSGNIATIPMTAAGQIAPADYDGDGKTDAAVFTASTGTWKIRKSTTGTEQIVTGFGQSGDKAVSGNFVGTATADLAVYRNGTWLVKDLSNGQITTTTFGQAGDIAVPGNYDGDSLMDYAVFRPASGEWHIQGSLIGYQARQWGVAADIPVPADYDGDGETDCAVYRGSDSTWYVFKSGGTSGEYITQIWGNYGDQPVPADYDGDNKADFAVWRPTTGVWHIIKSATGGYSYQTLGLTSDTAAESAYLKQIGGPVQSYDLAKARLSPKNATGGTDLYSQNFGWSSGLVSLPGRAGLDAGFGISYNSLVWTKQGSSVVFDADQSNVSPGFRFGFPVIEPTYYDSQTGRFAYLMVAPSGARVEFKQTAASDSYETADSSYVILKTVGAVSPNDPVENITIKLYTTDGAQMTYEWKAGAFRCSQIKDRNGNFITVEHDAQGLLQKVTDTLGREIKVIYDAQLDPVRIEQIWQNTNGTGSNVTQEWATFSYGNITINTNFGGLGVVGPQNGTTLKVLNKVSYADDSSTRFEYNSYGQVWRVNNFAADQLTKLNHTSVNLNDVTGAQTDCPRFTQTRNLVENFNVNAQGTAQEVVINNSLQPGQPYNVGGVSGTGTLIQVAMVNHPNGSVSNTFVGETGWNESLPIVTEDWADEGQGLQRKRWTWTKWTQDDTNLAYILNPRVTETKVGDATNTKRTTVEYAMLGQAAYFGLVTAVNVYDTDQTTVLKRVATEYGVSVAQYNRRMVGLPTKKILSAKNDVNQLAMESVVAYGYDEVPFNDPDVQQNISPVQHDPSFDVNFVDGRGNLTSVSRYDVFSQSAPSVSRTTYDVAGSVVAQTDAAGRKVKMSYADKFNDPPNENRNTFAYPTKITDPAGNFSEVKYRHDMGANIWAKSPAPAGNTVGQVSEREYDDNGRLTRQQITGGAYTKYEYPATQNYSRVLTTVTDVNGNGSADAADEVLTETWFDGAGRTRATRTPLRFNASGTPISWTGQTVEYDLAGRTKRQSVPIEVDINWNTAGDDGIWRYTSQEYDWKGRVTKEIGLDNVERNYSYDGCGCAGGEVVTIKGEQLAEGRRTQKIYSDILGRQWKTEVMNWDGVTPYTTTVAKFNGRDQVTSARQYAGAEGSPTFQESINIYDGHGRLQQSHAPQQDAGKFTTYTYFADDRPYTVTDARDASATYTYNSRGLVENINYSLPNARARDECPNGGEWPICEPPVPPTSSPEGWLDGIHPENNSASGWTLDRDNPNASIEVHFYIDGPAGSGQFAGSTTANQPRPDVNQATGLPGNHGFEFVIPAQFRDGQYHTIYAYGIDTGDDGNIPALQGSPKPFVLGTPPPPPPQTYSPDGRLDGVSTTDRNVWGWSIDPDNPSASNTVHLYFDRPADGYPNAIIAANLPRTDIPTPGDHGFEFPVPGHLIDNQWHKVYAYGIDTGTDPPKELPGSPKYFRIAPVTPPPPPPPPPPINVSVSFEYDNLGNRTKMTDATGITTYEYDNLSRMRAENKHLRDDWTIPQRDFNIQYGYDLAGQLKNVTDPYGQRIDYGTDKAGKMKQITGTPYNSTDETGQTAVTNYIDNIDYRAWGAVKAIDYGNNTSMAQSFDNRLQVSEFRVWKDGQNDSLIKKNYQYYDDGRLKFSSDTGDAAFRIDAHRFDRSYAYDQMGRLTQARTGAEARGETNNPDRNITPYKHDYAYNAFGNVTSRQTFTWNQANNQTHTWTNDRESTWGYDADGRLKFTPENYYAYNAAGAVMRSSLTNVNLIYHHTDGEGRSVRRDIYKQTNGYNTFEKTEYSIYSSVLGKALTEVKSDGAKKKTNVYGAGGQLVATQNAASTTLQHVVWNNLDPSSASYLPATHTGRPVYLGDDGQAELDPLGSNVQTSNPFDAERPPNLMQMPGGGGGWGDPFGGYSCMVDWVSQPCSYAAQVLGSGAGDIGPLDPIAAWQKRRYPDGKEKWVPVPWERGADGRLGYWSTDGKTYTSVDNGKPAWDGKYVKKWNPFGSSTANYASGINFLRFDTSEIEDQQDCDKYLSNLFGDEGAYFFDNTTHQIDAIMGDRLSSGLAQGVDSHLYGSKTDPNKSTNIYVPRGFEPISPGSNFANKFPVGEEGATRNKYIGRENEFDGRYKQNYVLFYNKSLNLTLAIWHVDDYSLKKQADGRTRVGTTGFSHLSGGELEGGGGHSHFDLYVGRREWLPAPGSARAKVRRSFRELCP